MENIINQITPDIKGLIFDLDGTLANTIPLHQEAWLKAGEALGFHVTNQMIAEHSGTPTEKIAIILNDKFKWGVDPDLITSTKLENYRRLKNLHGRIKPIETILALAKRYYKVLPMSVGTGSSRHNALSSLEDIEALHLFETVVTASDVVNPKPHPETFIRCAKAMGLQPNECLVFEDGAMGIKAAIDGGMKLVDVKPYLL